VYASALLGLVSVPGASVTARPQPTLVQRQLGSSLLLQIKTGVDHVRSPPLRATGSCSLTGEKTAFAALGVTSPIITKVLAWCGRHAECITALRARFSLSIGRERSVGDPHPLQATAPSRPLRFAPPPASLNPLRKLLDSPIVHSPIA
jgi:hypothetical protein